MSQSDDYDSEKNLGVVEARPKLKKPAMYQVLLMNDDFTPMDFVIDVLQQFFAMSTEKATRIMLQVHTEGKGICGVFSIDVAETKVLLVNDYSKEHQHPLLCMAVKLD
ncbi:MAG: ATP-dependent Clp protease adapter ClpS [Gammaproteobacteria bacterium]|nr:ATP-dependent Clp protease adapter ClpS [Gammaproteobacteria bacterium]